MKIALRVIALSSIVPILIVGNALPKEKAMAAMQRSTVPGPIPICNPLTQNCPNIRER